LSKGNDQETRLAICVATENAGTTQRPYKADTSFIRYCLCLLFVFADLVADDATDRRTANSSTRAAARKHGTTNGADSRADRGVPLTSRHLATSTQAD
jgi:hypothetical protein